MAAERGGHGRRDATPAALSDRAARSTAASGGGCPPNTALTNTQRRGPAGPGPPASAPGCRRPGRQRPVLAATSVPAGQGAANGCSPAALIDAIAGLDQHARTAAWAAGLTGSASSNRRRTKRCCSTRRDLQRAAVPERGSDRWRCRRCRNPAGAGSRARARAPVAGNPLEHPQHRMVHGGGQRVVPLPGGERLRGPVVAKRLVGAGGHARVQGGQRMRNLERRRRTDPLVAGRRRLAPARARYRESVSRKQDEIPPLPALNRGHRHRRLSPRPSPAMPAGPYTYTCRHHAITGQTWVDESDARQVTATPLGLRQDTRR